MQCPKAFPFLRSSIHSFIHFHCFKRGPYPQYRIIVLSRREEDVCVKLRARANARVINISEVRRRVCWYTRLRGTGMGKARAQAQYATSGYWCGCELVCRHHHHLQGRARRDGDTRGGEEGPSRGRRLSLARSLARARGACPGLRA